MSDLGELTGIFAILGTAFLGFLVFLLWKATTRESRNGLSEWLERKREQRQRRRSARRR